MCVEARRGCWVSSYNCLAIPFESRSLPEPGACIFSSSLEASIRVGVTGMCRMPSLLSRCLDAHDYTASAYNKSAHNHQVISSAPFVHFK